MDEYDFIERTVIDLCNRHNLDYEETVNLLAEYISDGFEKYVFRSTEE